MRAIVITASDASLKTLHLALEAVGVGDRWVLGNHLGDRVLDEFQADFVVGVLGPLLRRAPEGDEVEGTGRVPGFGSTDVMLRVGRLVERGLPALVFAPPPIPTPAPAASLVAASCPLDDREALDLHLWAFVSALSTQPRRGQRRDAGMTAARVITSTQTYARAAYLLRSLSRDLAGAGANLAGLKVEELIVDLLEEAGAEVAENPERAARDEGFDAALIPFKGSKDILLVEVTTGSLSRRRLQDKAQRLQAAVIARESSLGILIYQDREGRRFEPIFMPAVIMIAAEDLAERLTRSSLAEIVNEEVAAAAGRL